MAKNLRKDQGYISKEIKLLSMLGVIELIPNKSGGREKLIPMCKYDKVVFEILLDDMSDPADEKHVSGQKIS